MFGLALRTYHDKVRRLSESSTVRGKSLWEATLAFIQERETVLQADVLQQFRNDDDATVRGVLTDLVESGMIFRSGRGIHVTFRAAKPESAAPDPVAQSFVTRARTSKPVPGSALDATGWVESSSAYTPINGATWLNGIDGFWNVPEDPDNGSEYVFFIFLSLDSPNWIVQSVLQWGYSGAYWEVASWYVQRDGTGWFSPRQRTHSGDQIYGNVDGDNCSQWGRCDWHIKTFNQATGWQTTANVSRNTIKETFIRADQGAVEAYYDVDICGSWPNTNQEVDFAWVNLLGNPIRRRFRHSMIWRAETGSSIPRVAESTSRGCRTESIYISVTPANSGRARPMAKGAGAPPNDGGSMPFAAGTLPPSTAPELQATRSSSITRSS